LFSITTANDNEGKSERDEHVCDDFSHFLHKQTTFLFRQFMISDRRVLNHVFIVNEVYSQSQLFKNEFASFFPSSLEISPFRHKKREAFPSLEKPLPFIG